MAVCQLVPHQILFFALSQPLTEMGAALDATCCQERIDRRTAGLIMEWAAVQ